jgi:hypothetical protein
LPAFVAARIRSNAPYELSRTLISVPNTSNDINLGNQGRSAVGMSGVLRLCSLVGHDCENQREKSMAVQLWRASQNKTANPYVIEIAI